MIKRILFFTLLLITTQLFSQRLSSSPYSIFGVGEEFGTRTVEQIAMGSVGAAYSSNRYLNFINPAALADLTFTTYAFGALNSRLNVSNSNTNQSTNTTSISYVALGVPIVKNKVGFIFGMQPTSAIGYSLIKNIRNADNQIIDLTQFTGNGSINRIYAGLGAKFFKKISVGFEADFLFGNTQNSILNARQSVALATKNVENLDARGGSVKVGVQYKHQLKNDIKLTVGGTFKLGNTTRFTGNEYLYTLVIGNQGLEVPKDTLFSGALRGNLKMPTETVLGIGLGKENKWFASLDYKTRSALNSTGFFNNTSQTFRFGKANRYSLGGFFIPKINSISSFWERVTYRAGVKYEQTGLLVNGIPNGTNFTSVNDFGISFGLGLPIGRRTLSNVNLTFEYGKKGTKDNGLLQENYLNLRLSLSLIDSWFIKRTID